MHVFMHESPQIPLPHVSIRSLQQVHQLRTAGYQVICVARDEDIAQLLFGTVDTQGFYRYSVESDKSNKVS